MAKKDNKIIILVIIIVLLILISIGNIDLSNLFSVTPDLSIPSASPFGGGGGSSP